MTRHTIPALCLTLLLLVGSPPTLTGAEDEQLTRIYRPKHAQADALARLVSQSGTLVRADPALGVVLVQGRAAQVSMVIETLAEVDTPQPDPAPADPAPADVVLDLHLVGAFRGAAESFAAPEQVQKAIAEIRDTFPFESYQLLESLTVRTTPDGHIATVRGHIQSQERVDYSVMLVLADERPNPEAIKLSLIGLELTRDSASGDETAKIETQLTAAHGKTLVVGKAGVRGIADGIFLLLTARLE